MTMDMKIELLAIPVSDLDKAKAFYVDKVGFHDDYDVKVSDELRFIQLTPPGSACSIVLDTNMTAMEPGAVKGVQMVVADAAGARQELLGRGVEASELDTQDWGTFVYFSDPDGNSWALQQIPPRD
jgi:catechol 2,3-dioxygenase-like lactoylglutathione lyase family enzyme